MSEAPAPPRAAPGAPVLWARAAAFWLGMAASTVFFSLTGLLTAPLPFRARYAWISLWSGFNVAWLRLTCGVRYRVEGAWNLPSGGAVILAKHQSTWETLFLSWYFRPQAQVVKRELLRIPFFGWGFALLEPVAIERKAGRHALRQLIEQGRARLEDGRWVLVFPEGHRMPPGVTGRYHLGGAKLAERTGYPVVPIAHNAGTFWPRGSFLKYPGTVRVVIGPLIDPKGRSAEGINAEAKRWIEAEVAALEGRSATPPERDQGADGLQM
ncbi:MAG: 1-acyl-sn-glycerol-3-phosphate acyltransferase [Gammaproteobacteria bacterium]|nr:1-acyl-sn-glycerol-3-phosphate acyltransferase [Gammaproteobacteria bacterium]